MNKKSKSSDKPVYYVDEQNGRFYVYYLQVQPVSTLFDIKQTKEEAEQAIKEHKEGKHGTQYRPE